MSWIENAKKDFTIIMQTKHGNITYTPNWLNARRSIDYNIAEFNFKNVAGTLVKRSQPMGVRYDIEIYFQGEDNLIKAQDFLDSAADPRAWTVSHPMYGQLYVQPIGLGFDDSNLNATKITSIG